MMTQPNYDEKALVPYGFNFNHGVSSNKRKHFGSLDKALAAISSFFDARFKLYAVFLFIFFALSVFSFGIISDWYEYGVLWLESVTDSYSSSSLGLLYYLQSPVICLPFRALAFVGGFTCFAFPLTILSAVRVFFSQCFILSLVSFGVSDLIFFDAFAFILLFALQILIDICFFTETVRYASHYRKVSKTNRVTLYTVVFMAYISLCCFLSNLQISLI